MRLVQVVILLMHKDANSTELTAELACQLQTSSGEEASVMLEGMFEIMGMAVTSKLLVALRAAGAAWLQPRLWPSSLVARSLPLVGSHPFGTPTPGGRHTDRSSSSDRFTRVAQGLSTTIGAQSVQSARSANLARLGVFWHQSLRLFPQVLEQRWEVSLEAA